MVYRRVSRCGSFNRSFKMSLGISKADQTKKNKEPRRKKCKECGQLFVPTREMQPCCDYACEVMYIDKNLDTLVNDGKKRTIKEQNKKLKDFKDKDKSFQMGKAQQVFNKFVRLRDINEPCISCDYIWNENNHQRQAHASHFMSVGKAKGLRFNEDNVHKSCQQCNTHLSGNLVEYRPRLINKIGLEKVEELELLSKSKEPKKYSVEDYKNIIHTYNLKIKELESE